MILTKITCLRTTALASFFVPFRSPFSSIKLKAFSASAQKAVWASAIIREILEAQPTNALDSLQRRVKNLKLPAAIQDTDGDIEREMKLPFVQGITLDGFFLKNQNRLTQITKHQKVLSCPNYNITQPMFQHLFDENISHYINSEQLRTSKTVSIVLGNVLSKPILSFKMDTLNDKQKKEELDVLNKNKLIQRTPKFLYWSVPQQAKKLDIQDVISQLQDLPQPQLQELAKIKDIGILIDAITYAYWKVEGTLVKVVIDQINTAASIIRKWNSRIRKPLELSQSLEYDIRQQQKKLQQKLKNATSFEESDRIKTISYRNIMNLEKKYMTALRTINNIHKNFKSQKKQVEAMVGLIGTYRQFGSLLLFNSSENIEEDILTRKMYDRPLYGLQIIGFHFHIVRRHIHYFEALKQVQGRRDFFNLFWFEMIRRMPSKPVDQNSQRDFYEVVKDIPIKHYCQPLSMNEYLNQQFSCIRKDLFPLLNTTEESNMVAAKKYFKQLIDGYNAYCLSQSKQKMQKFVNTEEKRDFATIIYELAKNLEKENKEQIVIQLEFDNADSALASDLLLSKSHNKELIPIEYDADKQRITLHWTAKEFIEIAENVVDSVQLHKHLFLYKVAKDNQEVRS